MSISPFLSLIGGCDEVFQQISKQLTQAGLHPIRTFDLHTARAGLHPCACPNHGTVDCDCQMIVVLVYGKGEEPVTLILHGNDGQTWLSMAESSSPQNETTVLVEIRQALEKAPGSISQAG